MPSLSSFRGVWLVLTFGLCVPVSAADISSMGFDDNSAAILIIGDIEKGDAAKFRKEAGKHEDAIVFLDSDGGRTAEAIEIGEAIRLKGFGTAVVNGSDCNSACALIWLAGTPRALSKSGRVGFHATYTDVAGKSVESGVGNAIVGRYLTLLNLSERALIFATTAPPTALNYLTTANYNSVGIETKVMEDFDTSSSSTTKASDVQAVSAKPKAPVFWKKAGGWSVAVDPTIGNGCFLLARFVNDTTFRIGIDSTSDDYYMMVANPKWKSLKTNEKHALKFEFDDQGPWDVSMTVADMGGEKVLISKFGEKRFWAEFVKASDLHVRRGDSSVTSISMAGSSQGFAELIKCQEYQNSRTPTDPFAKR